MSRKQIVAGNWKMNGLREAAGEMAAIAAAAKQSQAQVMIFPPFTLIQDFCQQFADVIIGGQDCHPNNSGAHTGDIAASMLADLQAGAVIVGHSERRSDHSENSKLVAQKALAASKAGLTAIICIGETEAQYDKGETKTILAEQLAQSVPAELAADQLVIAYEPVWAIGTGKTPTLDEIQDVHAFIRHELASRFGEEAAQNTPLLYGGSVKAANAAEIFALPDVDGGLVGGASLKAADFVPIIEAAG